MIDPQAATDQEVDAWLAKHCLELRTKDGRWYNEGTCLHILGGVHPTSDYEQLVMCEAKVQDRWQLSWQRQLNGTYSCAAMLSEDADGMSWKGSWANVEAGSSSELRARAGLVVAVMIYEEENKNKEEHK